MHAPRQPEISPEMLLLAYRSGIFPMADARDDPEMFWVEPRERAIIPLADFHCSRSLARDLKRGRYRVTCNAAFGEVVAACAAPRGDESGSWISHRIEDAFEELHRLGHAHSIECWQDGELVGGLYGLAFDQVFCGESMFSRQPNASKIALSWLVAAMRRGGYRLLDCQFMTDHLASMGAIEIAQSHYLELVKAAGSRPTLRLPDAYSALSSDASAAGVSPGKLIAQSLTQTS